MKNRRFSTVFSLMVLCLITAPAVADMSLGFQVWGTNLTYTTSGSGGSGTVGLGTQASITASLYTGPTEVDNTTIGSYVGSSLSLTFSQQAANDWTAIGTLTMNDNTNNPRVLASFASSGIDVTPGTLSIMGELTPLDPNPAVLVGATGNTWTFQGTSESIVPAGGSDGRTNQISVSPWQSWQNGALVSLNFGNLPFSGDEDAFFGMNRQAYHGYMSVASVVPVPGAILLGMLGLSVAGLKLRKLV